ncbi:MAG: sensor histidine kinase [Acidimicrobiales bacterium]
MGRLRRRGHRAPVRHRGWRPGTALRLAAFETTVLAAILGVVVVALVHQFSGSYQSVAADALTGQLQSFATAAARSPTTSRNLFDFSRRYLRTHSLPTGDLVMVGIHGGGIVGTTGTRRLTADPDIAAWIAHPPARAEVAVHRIDHVDQEVLAAPIRSGGRTLGTFVATSSLAGDEGQRLHVLVLSIAEAGVAVIGGGLSAHLLLRRLLRTVGRITATAEEIQEDELDLRLGDQGTDDEVSQLAGTFDAMLDRLASVMAAQRRLLSDVSHQLRTPLTIARGHLEVLARIGYNEQEATEETVTLVLDELERMSGLVDRLLLLGRAIEPDFLQLEPIDLRSFIGDVHESAVVLADRRWTMGDVPDVIVWVDAPKLRGAMLNILDNAVKVTAPADRIALRAALDPARGGLVLTVEDSGPGIPLAERQKVLGRFARVTGSSTSGTGLGLAIVDAVARAHGGTVEISSSGLGGAQVGIALPAELLCSVGGDRR